MDGKKTVLTIDDSLMVAKVVSKHLEGTEFSMVGEARNGLQGVEKFEQLRPDIVLLDFVMPVQGGEETLKQIFTIDPRAVVIVLSTFGTKENIDLCKQLGARRFVHKPFEKEKLLTALRGALES